MVANYRTTFSTMTDNYTIAWVGIMFIDSPRKSLGVKIVGVHGRN